VEDVRRLLFGEIGGYQVGVVRVILRQLSGFQRGIRQIPLTKVELHDPVLGVSGINPIVRRRGDDCPVCLDDVVDIASRALGRHGLGNESGAVWELSGAAKEVDPTWAARDAVTASTAVR